MPKPDLAMQGLMSSKGSTHVQVLVQALEVELGVGGADAHGVAGAWLDEVNVREAQLVQLLEQVGVQGIWVRVLRLCHSTRNNDSALTDLQTQSDDCQCAEQGGTSVLACVNCSIRRGAVNFGRT